jgi:tetratricopeptide (TPR) repeat protein/tRNA A-37 threonylcarbamoyl transferase component Bud32
VRETIDREQWRRISPILDAVLTMPLEARAAHLDRACAGDSELRRHVEELLAAEEASPAFLATAGGERGVSLLEEALSAPGRDPSEPESRTFGAYRLLHELGEGGMGTVYLAERIDGHFEQQVAVKVLKQGVASAEALRRFLQERQILARLQHPGIARLLDGGVTTEGTPYFVMERVEGRPLTTYCDQERLGVDGRLRVFLAVCDAVRYAHRNLVVHRDLKPSNVLVDAAGHVKLLDFGIAKLLSEGTGEAAPARTTLRAMTPEYAAPEQVRAEPVTTATDVYTLGVILYELLAGERPYRIERASAPEIERAILEQEPRRPSARAAAGKGLPGVAPRDLGRRLRGDLDGIVLKALEKEPERRYASAEALATDVRRHLDGLPVAAQGARLAYRARKFVRRHRVGVAAASLVLASLVVGLVGTVYQARRAEAEARKASAVKDFLKSVFSASDPAQAQGKTLTAKQLLDDGARRIDTELSGQPDVQSEVRRLIASVYFDLAEYEPSRSLRAADLERQRALHGARSLEAAEVLGELGDALFQLNRRDEARGAFEEALAIETERRGPRTPQAAILLRGIGQLDREGGELAASREKLERAAAILAEAGQEDSKVMTETRESLAITHSMAGRRAEAVVLHAQVAAWRERHQGPDHPDALTARYNQGSTLTQMGRMAEGVAILEDVAARQRRILGPRHNELAYSLRVVATSLDTLGRSAEALPYIAEAVAIHRQAVGPGHVQTVVAQAAQAMIEARAGRLAEAQRDCRAVLASIPPRKGWAPAFEPVARYLCGIALAEAGRLGEAAAQFDEAAAQLRATRGPSTALARALDGRADVARRQGHLAQAVELAREAVSMQEHSTGEEHPQIAIYRARAGAALWAAGQRDEGERLLRQGVTGMERSFPDGHIDLANGRFLLGQALAGDGRAAEARPFLDAALRWREAHLGTGDPRTLAVRRALAGLRS